MYRHFADRSQVPTFCTPLSCTNIVQTAVMYRHCADRCLIQTLCTPLSCTYILQTALKYRHFAHRSHVPTLCKPLSCPDIVQTSVMYRHCGGHSCVHHQRRWINYIIYSFTPHLFMNLLGGVVRIHWSDGRSAYLPENTASHFKIIAVRTPNRAFWQNNLSAQFRCAVTVYFRNVFGCLALGIKPVWSLGNGRQCQSYLEVIKRGHKIRLVVPITAIHDPLISFDTTWPQEMIVKCS